LDYCPDVLRVGIFGSVATGRAVPGSDLDVLIVLRHSDERPIDRPARFQQYFEHIGLPVDLFCFTEAEASGSRFVRSISREAIWIERGPDPRDGPSRRKSPSPD